MHVLVYEFVTGGGFLCTPDALLPANSLLREGLAMARAVVEDFAGIADTRVTLFRDTRLAAWIESPDVTSNLDVIDIANQREHWRALSDLSASADHILIIAPEIDGHLFRICRFVEDGGGQLISPPSSVISWTADKHLTAVRLGEAGIRVPLGAVVSSGLPSGFPFPAVVKPLRGAGSLGVRLISDERTLGELDSSGSAQRIEQLIPGRAASVAALTGPNGCQLLPACWQLLTADGCFSYSGGQSIDAVGYARRARRLAAGVVDQLIDSVGYVGIDMVLGTAEDGSEDVVIEVNPRLTTSYVGLRRATRQNLADAMIRVAQGENVDLSFHGGKLEFRSDGQVVHMDRT